MTGTRQPDTIAQDARRLHHSPATAFDPPTLTIQTFEQANAPSAAQRVASARGVGSVSLCLRARVGGEAGRRFRGGPERELGQPDHHKRQHEQEDEQDREHDECPVQGCSRTLAVVLLDFTHSAFRFRKVVGKDAP